MKPSAIVYTSNTGYTAEYARMLGEKTGLPVYELSNMDELKKGTPILYLGWLFASNVKGYKKAAKKFQITAVCGVGLCDTGTMLAEVRKAISLPESTPLFTIQGGMDHSKLHGINKMMINMLIKGLKAKAERSEDEERMLSLVQKGGNYVSEENLAAVLAWHQK
ncbi:MAG: hypothetical protein J6C37_08020 [Roseburia sp.]|nr:hypothetical protein [Roseburia sp.]